MKQTILRYGLYSFALLMGVNLLVLLIFGKTSPEDYKLSEIVGYTTIVLSLLFVFFGIKYYRDELNEGKISFWKAVLLGLGISVLPSLAFGIYNFAYMEWIDPSFAETYMNHSIEQAQASMDMETFEKYKTSMEKNKDFFMNTGFQSILMFFTVFIIGTIVSFLSSFILKKA